MTASIANFVEQALGHRPKDLSLFERALTHSSAGPDSYERLEFLGDRVLGLTIARTLYERYPNEPEGKLSRRYNALVARGNDVGSPWAIGSKDGGHDAIHPDLGTIDDFDAFVERANQLGLEVALDLALQAAPDHPWAKEHPEFFEEYFGTVIPAGDNKFAALNTAVWSGGSFVYVPPGVHVEIPLQAYFRINTENMGQFERTLIIVDEDAYVHYVEGCTAPIYSSDSLPSAVVEIIVKKGGRCRYTTIQNWSNNVYNLVTKRAVAYEDATMEWVDGNLGSKVTMKYPAIWLMGERAHGEVLSIAFAGKGQHQDAGGKVVHVAKNTSSVITSKSISKNGGRGGYRGLLEVAKGAHGSKSKVVCDALILDEESRSDTYPYIDVKENDVDLGHEATVSKIGEEQLFYLMSRGLSEAEASAMIVSGFVEPITKELPLEYAVEMNRLIQLQMEGSVG